MTGRGAAWTVGCQGRRWAGSWVSKWLRACSTLVRLGDQSASEWKSGARLRPRSLMFVLDSRRDLRVVRADDQAVAFELPEPLGQDLRRDHADPPLQLHEPLPAVLVQRPQDRRGPPAEHQVHHRRRSGRPAPDPPLCCSLTNAPFGQYFPLGTYYPTASSVLVRSIERGATHDRGHRSNRERRPPARPGPGRRRRAGDGGVPAGSRTLPTTGPNGVATGVGAAGRPV